MGPDAGTVAVLMCLAATIDGLDADDEGRLRPFDNVTIPTYLKYAVELGLTVASRKRAAASEGSQGGGAGDGGGLAQVLQLAGLATG